MATAPIRPLAWEPPYAAGAAQEIATTTKDKELSPVPGAGIAFSLLSPDQSLPALKSDFFSRQSPSCKMSFLNYLDFFYSGHVLYK